MFRDRYSFSHTWIFFLLIVSLLTLFSSRLILTSIDASACKSESWLLKFLRMRTYTKKSRLILSQTTTSLYLWYLWPLDFWPSCFPPQEIRIPFSSMWPTWRGRVVGSGQTQGAMIGTWGDCWMMLDVFFAKPIDVKKTIGIWVMANCKIHSQQIAMFRTKR